MAYSDHLGLTGKMLANAMAAAAHTWIVDTSVPFNVPTLMGYNGVFLGVTPADNQLLIDYVNAGEKVYVYSGGNTESGKWNAFLQQIGLRFEIVNSGRIGDIPVTSSHPMFSGVDHLDHDTGTSVLDLDLADPKNQVVATFQAQGLFAVYDGVVGPRVGGSVTGVSPTKVVCRNVTTRQKVIIRDPARLWDCEAAGLIVHPGDKIQQTVTGAAD